MYCRLGALMGAPMVTDGRYTSPGHRRGWLRQQMFYMTILGKHDLFLPTWKEA